MKQPAGGAQSSLDRERAQSALRQRQLGGSSRWKMAVVFGGGMLTGVIATVLAFLMLPGAPSRVPVPPPAQPSAANAEGTERKAGQADGMVADAVDAQHGEGEADLRNRDIADLRDALERAAESGDWEQAQSGVLEALTRRDGDMIFLDRVSGLLLEQAATWRGIDRDNYHALVGRLFRRRLESGGVTNDALRRMSGFFVEIGEIDFGMELLDHLVERNPYDTDALKELALLELNRGMTEQARGRLERLARIHPDDARIALAYAGLLMNEGMTDEAVEIFAANEDAILEEEEMAIHYARILFQKNRLDAMEGFLAKASDSLGDSVRLPYFRALGLYGMKRFPEAYSQFLLAEQRAEGEEDDPLDGQFYFAMASCASNVNDYKLAERAYLKAIEAEGGMAAPAHNNLAYLYLQQNDHIEEAVKLARKAVEMAPEEPGFRHTLGLALLQKGRFVQAVEELEEAMNLLDEPNVEVLTDLGDAYNEVGMSKRAANLWKQAAELRPHDSGIRQRLKLSASSP